jgi:uncharacterized protein
MIPKEIYKLDLALTTQCNQRCKYCFVNKTNELMDFGIAKSAVDLLISSPGRKKILIIYGGEPLLLPALLRKVILFTEEKARACQKEVIISLGTNGTLCNEGFLNFLEEHDVKFSLSLDGNKKFHDRNRKFKNGRGAFNKVYKKIPLIKKILKKENICALTGIDPKFAVNMFEIYVYIVKSLGIDSVNLEPIESFHWSTKSTRYFLLNFIKMGNFILNNLRKGSFFFINSVNRLLIGDNFTHICPFYKNIEIYPSGDISFSPFLINRSDKDKYSAGNIKTGFVKQYANCKFSPASKYCKSCWKNYSSGSFLSSKIYSLRDSISVKLATHIRNLSRHSPIVREYISAAKERIFE